MTYSTKNISLECSLINFIDRLKNLSVIINDKKFVSNYPFINILIWFLLFFFLFLPPPPPCPPSLLVLLCMPPLLLHLFSSLMPPLLSLSPPPSLPLFVPSSSILVLTHLYLIYNNISSNLTRNLTPIYGKIYQQND